MLGLGLIRSSRLKTVLPQGGQGWLSFSFSTPLSKHDSGDIDQALRNQLYGCTLLSLRFPVEPLEPRRRAAYHKVLTRALVSGSITEPFFDALTMTLGEWPCASALSRSIVELVVLLQLHRDSDPGVSGAINPTSPSQLLAAHVF